MDLTAGAVDTAGKVGRDAAAGVVRGGYHWDLLFSKIHGTVTRGEVGMNGGEAIAQPGSVAVGHVEKGIVPIATICSSLLTLSEDRTGDNVPRRQLGGGVVVAREGPSRRVAQNRTLASERLGEEETCLVREAQRGWVELDVLEVRRDTAFSRQGAIKSLLEAQGKCDTRTQRVEPTRVCGVLVNPAQSTASQNHAVNSVCSLDLIRIFVKHLRADDHAVAMLVGNQVGRDGIPSELDERMRRRRSRDRLSDRAACTIGVMDNTRRRVTSLEAQAQHRIILGRLLPHSVVVIVRSCRGQRGAVKRHDASGGSVTRAIVLRSQQQLPYACRSLER
mmetsp:Transcript_33963/g.81308  ORF Transcript_33963/g.81308 Transcript_33963/m.81308 type:complete len:334 (+) Transcript_33963:829-1830(+)